MSDEIKNALTPEEWKQRTARRGHGIDEFEVSGWDTIVGVHNGADSVYPTEARHALAALCLYGQPFGFTREDVAAIEAEAQGLLRAALWCPEGYSVENPIDAMSNAEFRAKAARLQSLAARIAALLPPEETL